MLFREIYVRQLSFNAEHGGATGLSGGVSRDAEKREGLGMFS